MKENKVIAMVRAKKTIEGIVEEGCVYNPEELKREHPYIDLNTKEYFETVFPNNKFSVGDKVSYIGNSYYIPKNKTLVIVEVLYNTPVMNYNWTEYKVSVWDTGNCKRKKLTWFASENELVSNNNKWIISFSTPSNQSHPAVCELDYFVWQNKIKHTWKNIFVFNTKEEATRIACLLAENKMDKIH